jgi:hypothetical protein
MWRQWMRGHQLRVLVIWGRFDPSFDISRPAAYLRGVPAAEVHVLHPGRFALDTAADEIAGSLRSFVGPAHRAKGIRRWPPFEPFSP